MKIFPKYTKYRSEKTAARRVFLTNEEWAELNYSATVNNRTVSEEISDRISYHRVVPSPNQDRVIKDLGDLTLVDVATLEKATGDDDLYRKLRAAERAELDADDRDVFTTDDLCGWMGQED